MAKDIPTDESFGVFALIVGDVPLSPSIWLRGSAPKSGRVWLASASTILVSCSSRTYLNFQKCFSTFFHHVFLINNNHYIDPPSLALTAGIGMYASYSPPPPLLICDENHFNVFISLPNRP